MQEFRNKNNSHNESNEVGEVDQSVHLLGGEVSILEEKNEGGTLGTEASAPPSRSTSM